MIKNLLFSILAIFPVQHVFSQKTFHLKLVLDSSIDSKKITCDYYDGKHRIFIVNKFLHNIIKVKGLYFSHLASFTIAYASDLNYYSCNFFIDDKPAQIHLYLTPKKQDNRLKYSTIINAQPIFDTNTNMVYKGLFKYRLKEAKAVSEFWKIHGTEIFRDDSITHILGKLYKLLNDRSMLFLKKYPRDYFSFWYFRDQIIDPSLRLFKGDSAYLKRLIVYFRSVFPTKYTESIEGKELIKHVDEIINPSKLYQLAPEFTFNDINGNKIDLSDFRGKYVLLDFWATWCLPCMNQLPFIKEIRKTNSLKRLTIISVSQDIDSARLRDVIIKNKMNWIHIFDQDDELSKLYGVIPLPTLFLINKEGYIIYKDSNGKNDRERLLDRLKTNGLSF